jgi:hypothetical protein
VVGFPMVEPTHPSSSPRLGMKVRVYLDLFQNFFGSILLMVGDVPVNNKTQGAYRDRVCIPS